MTARRRRGRRGGAERRWPTATRRDEDAVAIVESTLTELLSAAGLLVEIRRRESTGDEMLFELIGDDVEPLLANKGEGLTGLEVLVGRIASKRARAPRAPAAGRRGIPRATARRRSRSSRTRPPTRSAARGGRSCCPRSRPGSAGSCTSRSPRIRSVETESEGDGFLKRVEVRLKSQRRRMRDALLRRAPRHDRRARDSGRALGARARSPLGTATRCASSAALAPGSPRRPRGRARPYLARSCDGAGRLADRHGARHVLRRARPP